MDSIYLWGTTIGDGKISETAQCGTYPHNTGTLAPPLAWTPSLSSWSLILHLIHLATPLCQYTSHVFRFWHLMIGLFTVSTSASLGSGTCRVQLCMDGPFTLLGLPHPWLNFFLGIFFSFGSYRKWNFINFLLDCSLLYIKTQLIPVCWSHTLQLC